MTKHRSVRLLEQPGAHVHDEIGSYSDEVGVVGSVVDLAKREPIGNDRLARRLTVGDDMSGVEQFWMAETAHGTTLRVSAQHPSPKHRLMEAGAGEASHVGALRNRERRQVDQALVLIKGDNEVVSERIFGLEPDRVAR